MSDRYLITRKSTGIGSDLISVVGALEYAIATNRELVIDWRGSRYLDDRNENLFDRLFEISPVIEGCHITIIDGRIDDKDLPQPILRSEAWSFPDYHQAMLSKQDPREPTIIITRAMHHLPTIERQRELLKHIQPVGRIRQRIDEFKRENMQDGQVGGVHIRHGNGEKLSQKRDLLIAADLFAEDGLLSKALARWAGLTPSLLACSDSATVHQQLIARHPHPIWLPTERGQSQAGPIHTKKHGLQGADDAVVEMWLLASCERLLFNPSWFSHYARVMGNFIEEPINIDTASDYGTDALYERLFREKAQCK
jgi:hypothetical protein